MRYSITAKGKKVVGTFSGHLDRILKALMAGEKDFEEITNLVAKHSDSDAPATISSWYLSQAVKMAYVVRKEAL